MAIKWMGRYRDFVSAVVKHSNQYNRVANVDSVSFEDKTFSSIEWQILEYVYEHPDDTGNMSVISEALGLAASSFSKSTVTTAISMPTDDSRFPFLAVSALPSSLMPLMKSTDEIMYNIVVHIVRILSKVTSCHLPSS